MRSFFANALVFLVSSGCASPEPVSVYSEPTDVLEALPSGAYVNWSRLVVQATFGHQGSGVAGKQPATEQLARQMVGPAIQDGVPMVRVSSEETIQSLMQDQSLGAVLENRIKRWAVSEATYHASGKVTLSGELDLTEYLRPWTQRSAQPEPEMPTVSAYTGLVVDARKTWVSPGYRARLLREDGEVIWDGHLWEAAVLERSPVVWVNDAAHESAARAGEAPLVVSATSSRGTDLVLDETNAGEVSRHLVGSEVLGRGQVVILVAR